ncbi:sugar ABC transporter substrate-binding protein [Dyadobacter fanqingshengii]|uniref:Sugar ABC transporter substrate-binding protein n=1 Tax=Dyadobacter fanqingshengii TaxID=2906443 RepID=A0A9X1TCA1_9BACT|nr:sugar ABC transporter substrate-binding protein [Dyadobacter fanqingshengii]MCF0042949.1 sugar ABC transporter substrate-binding protein [Dyadobacter fanqingshengii]USJ35504.1 sugar ABC transporter substrate-binding protein [Dyadobacter fanqingshengii]
MVNSLKYILIATLSFAITSCNQSQKSEGSESGSGKKLVVGATMLSMQNEFIVNVSDEMEAKAKELGVELITVDAERSALKQVEQVESFIAQGVDAIIMNPCEVEASSPAVKLAMDANIPIINVNSETSAKPTAFVGSDDTESARIAMKYLAEKLGGKGNVLIMHGFMGQAAQIKRDNGAKEILKTNPGMKLLAEQTGEWDRAKAMSLMENWIQSFGPKINAVFAHNDEMGMGAVKALEAAGLKDKVIVVSVDAIPDALQSVKKGALNATIFQNAQEQGGKAIETAVKAAKKEKFEKEVLIPFQLVTKENVGEYLK